MKIIKPSVEFFGAVPTDYDAAIRFIELAGRTCYKSEDKITEDSAEKFVKKLIKAGHLAMVEHSNFVVQLVGTHIVDFLILQAELGKYLNVHLANNKLYVGGNLTAWYQSFITLTSNGEESSDPEVFYPFINIFGHLFEIYNDYVDDAWQVCPQSEIPHSLHRYSAKFICDRGVTHEIVRHRPPSYAQESTRYVNYAGKNMEFIEPTGFDKWNNYARGLFIDSCSDEERRYNMMLKDGFLTPQQARAVLPNSLKTEIVVTADSAEWNHIRKLRTDKAAHPDMQRVMNMMPWEEFL